MLLFGKGISNGSQPLAGVIVKKHLFNSFYSKDKSMQLRHGFTNSGHPATCAAGNVMLDIMQKENVNKAVILKGKIFKEKLEALIKQVDFIEEIRGIGLMLAIETTKNIPDLDIALKEKGLLISQLCNVICLMPSVSITEQQMEEAIEIIKVVFMEKGKIK
jgi:adenosylmethionine-8-amino-7-oxononanoate aminotransferase